MSRCVQSTGRPVGAEHSQPSAEGREDAESPVGWRCGPKGITSLCQELCHTVDAAIASLHQHLCLSSLSG